jgi:hypothetical protein
MEQQMSPPVELDAVKLFRDYPFSTDEIYQVQLTNLSCERFPVLTANCRKQGLASIIIDGVMHGKTEAEKEVILRKTELFYFNR